MKKESCDVIRDLLPLYEDGVASEKAQKMVREHLADCPACREELRKMRTPLSLPPEQNEEMWKRYVEQRTKLQRKRRKKIAIAAAVLAVIVLACLWYTRPRTWTEITGGDVSIQFASLTMADPDWDAETATEKLGYKHWQIRQDDPELGEAGSAILQALGRCTFRASLDSLIPRDTISMGWGDDITISMTWGEEDRGFFFFGDNGKVISPGGWRYAIYHCDPALFAELAELIQTYGTLQEN